MWLHGCIPSSTAARESFMMMTTQVNGGGGSSPYKLNDDNLKNILNKIDELGLELKSVKEHMNKQPKDLKQLEEEDVVGGFELAESWRLIGSGDIMSGPETEENIFELEQDVYSFLVAYPFSSGPFWLALLVVYGFQYTLLLLLLSNQTDFESDNPLNLPENVDIEVRASQAMLLIIALFQQDDLLVGIETLVRGVPPVFLGSEIFRNMSSLRWSISCLMRMSTGLLGLLAAFVLSIQSENVFDVVLNVLGVEFVSNLDNVAFDLGSKGYFGRYVKRATREVSEATFHREKDTAWIKRILHIILALSVLIAALAGLVVIFYRQDSNFLSIRELQVEFQDEVVPFLGLFSGCYSATENRKLREFGSRRLLYAQDGFPLGGKFGFCSDFGNGESGWTFFVGDFRDPCVSHLLRSEDTATFSLLEAGHTLEWFTVGEDGESLGNIEIDEMTDRTTDCQGAWCIDAAVSHTIYYGESDSTPGIYDLIFFTGRRWVWTTTNEVLGLQNASSISEVSDYFYSSTEASSMGLFRLLEGLLANGGNQWVRFMSEAVDADTESPLGLEWYYPLYNDKTATVDVDTDSMDYSNIIQKLAFPPPDMSRILDSESVPTCQFCDLLKNPCLFEGVCDEQTGVCECPHGAAGALCQDRPLGDGICNLFFNTAEHNYDGGDCCASTCDGPFCGQDDLLDPYVSGSPTFNWLDSSDTEGMFEITIEDDVWMQEVEGISIAFGVNITANVSYQFPPLRYEHCIDPALAVIRIEVIPSDDESTPSSDHIFDGITVQCEGITYLKTPIFRVSNYSSPLFSEEVRVPYGGQCAFGFQGPGYFRGVSLLAEDNAIPFVELEQSCSVNVYIPQSSCVWGTFAGSSISVSEVGDVNCESSAEANESRRISVPEFDALGSDPILDGFCHPDPSQLLERYYVWDILSKGSGELVRASVGHVCDGGWNTGVFSVSCNTKRRVRRLALKSGASKSFVDSMTSNVKHFIQLERIEVQSRGVQVDELLEAMASVNVSDLVLGSDLLPSEIGMVRSLRALLLTSDLLASVPTAIGMLSKLEDLESYGTSLVSLPSEIGLITSLQTLDLGANKLSSIPTEVGLLQRLRTFSLETNNITSLPSYMGQMGALEQLLVKSNRLTNLPTELGMIRSLRSLDLANNSLVSVPSELGKLTNLSSLDVTGNNLTVIPSEILALTSLQIFGF